MKPVSAQQADHPEGEGGIELEGYPAARKLETFGGVVEVEWEDDGAAGMHGGLVYFIEFLKVSGLWERFVEECPLKYVSPNAPTKSEILGTILFSVLSGHRRYAHITGIRSDAILPKLLGIERFRSEDSIRRAFEKEDEAALTLWMDRQLDITFSALLRQDWILDLDATVKTLYGRQEEARVGYNPMKPGRPSHVYHAMVLSAAKLVLNVDAEAGNHSASCYGRDGIWGWLDARDREDWPTLLRGDIAYGNEEMMAGCEQRSLTYLFKLRQSQRVGDLLGKLARQGNKAGWSPAGKGWEGVSQQVQLQGWSAARRVVVLRRKLLSNVVVEQKEQPLLSGITLEHRGGDLYEHAVLVTNWREADLLAVAQMYRDRAGAENLFDELKNQWGWTGFSTQDLKRSQLMARIVALVYNWWSIFTRMGTGASHGEALTTRPLFQQAVVRRTKHANQTKLSISSIHAKARKAAKLLDRISEWLKQFIKPAEQLTQGRRWGEMLVRIFAEFGQFPLSEKSESRALVPVNCRI
jgi:hypothetical protein